MVKAFSFVSLEHPERFRRRRFKERWAFVTVFLTCSPSPGLSRFPLPSMDDGRSAWEWCPAFCRWRWQDVSSWWWWGLSVCLGWMTSATYAPSFTAGLGPPAGELHPADTRCACIWGSHLQTTSQWSWCSRWYHWCRVWTSAAPILFPEVLPISQELPLNSPRLQPPSAPVLSIIEWSTRAFSPWSHSTRVFQ